MSIRCCSRKTGRVSGWIIMGALLAATGLAQAELDPFTLTFQAAAGSGETLVTVKITPSAGFTTPTVADKIDVKTLDSQSGNPVAAQHYTNVPLVGGQATLSYVVVPANTPLSVQVSFRTIDHSRTNVLRAGTIALSNTDVGIDAVFPPGAQIERTTFNVSVGVREFSGVAGATFDIVIYRDDTALVVGTLTGVTLAAGQTNNVLVPINVNLQGNSQLLNFTAVLTNITPADSVASNNSMGFQVSITCSFDDIDCGS